MRVASAGLVLGLIAGCGAPAYDVQILYGGTRSLFMGESGFGEYNRDVEATTGERLRNALRTGDRINGEILGRMAVQLGNLRAAEPPVALTSAVSGRTGYAGRFLQAGARRYAFVLTEAAANPVADTCGYTGPLLPGHGERYDPRELCWWRETFRQAGVPVD